MIRKSSTPFFGACSGSILILLFFCFLFCGGCLFIFMKAGTNNRGPGTNRDRSRSESVDPDDILVSKKSLKLDELPWGAKVGTSSLRRKTQLKKFRSDFQIVDIRGNIEERLRLLDNHKSQVTNHKIRNLDAILDAIPSVQEKIEVEIPQWLAEKNGLDPYCEELEDEAR